MSGEESLINAAGESVGRKVPILGISVGAAETAKEGWDAKKAFARAANRDRSKQERIAATRAATICSRRAILKGASTVAGQIPVYGTAAAVALHGVNALLNVADGNPRELEKGASRSGVRKKRSTEEFMRAMREQAENAERGLRIAEWQAENADRGSRIAERQAENADRGSRIAERQAENADRGSRIAERQDLISPVP